MNRTLLRFSICVAVTTGALAGCGARTEIIEFHDGGTSIVSCDGGARSYALEAVSLPFINACDLPGAQQFMPNMDDPSTRMTMPFSFTLFAVRSSMLNVSNNGVVSLADRGVSFSNSCLSASSTGSSVYAFWDDLYSRGRGVCSAVTGSAGSRSFVVTWDNMYFCCGNNDPSISVNVSLVLHECSNVIEILYGRLDGGARALGGEATVGLTGAAAADVVQSSCNAPVLRANSAIRFVPRT